MLAMTERDNQTLIYTGTIAEVKAEGDKSLAIVDVLGRKTDWLPVLQQANSFKKHYTPIRVGEQVSIFINRFVIRGIFNLDCKEPDGANSHTEITEYEDGTRVEYNTQEKVLPVNAVGMINVFAQTANIFAATGDVIIDGVSLVHHTHKQNAGDHHGGGVDCNPPNKANNQGDE
ncbi:hypothetical protein AB835_04655 [Candidatus Endobugula sertula]|uniref:Gp5/Type VI secretion system Vgr protein OB-fold domain-containing protein n=1 Tax=Candidatus Endobugula sertula TaxID=62101 RepID=A0A1D2QRL0_9GAMM|nr:hypothetical protein AB835_04655 [Candidatus Endobugula sertula]